MVFEGTTDIYPITTVVDSDTAITLTNKYGEAGLSGRTTPTLRTPTTWPRTSYAPLDFQFFSQARNIQLIPRDEFLQTFLSQCGWQP